MKKIFILSIMIGMVVSACGAPDSVPTVHPAFTALPSATITRTATSVLTPTPAIIRPTEAPPTASFTPFPPYRVKKVIFEYYVVGCLSYFDPFYAESHPDYARIVLYDDGQMLIGRKQKFLSESEIRNLLSKLEALGFFSIESNQRHDREDGLYNFGSGYEEVNDGLKYCVSVDADKSGTVCAYEPYMQFLIPQMKNILAYLDGYKPTGMIPYYPDRILLSIQPVTPYDDNVPATATPWDNRFPSLDFSPPRKYEDDPPASILYLEGEMAKDVYLFLVNSHSRDVFIQDGKKYFVWFSIVLPHETIINAYQ
jgi:hypothetical protein